MGVLSGIIDAFDPSGKSVWGAAKNLVWDNPAELGAGLATLGKVALKDLGTLATQGAEGDYATDDIIKALPSAIGKDYSDRYWNDVGDQLYERPLDYVLDFAGVAAAAKGAGVVGKGVTKAEIALANKFPQAAEKASRYMTPAAQQAMMAAPAAGGIGGLGEVLSAITVPLGRKGRGVTVDGLRDYTQRFFAKGKPGYSYGQADPPRAIRRNEEGVAYFQDTPMRAFHTRGKGKIGVYPGDPPSRAEAVAQAHEQSRLLMPKGLSEVPPQAFVPGTEAYKELWDWLLSEDPAAIQHKRVMEQLGEKIAPEGLLRLYKPTTHRWGENAHETGMVGMEALLDPKLAEMAMPDNLPPGVVPTMNIFDVPTTHLMGLLGDPSMPEFQILSPANLFTPDGNPNVKGILDAARDPNTSPLLRKLAAARQLDGGFRAEKLAQLDQGPLPDAGGLGFIQESSGPAPGFFHGGLPSFLQGAPEPSALRNFDVNGNLDVPDPFMVLDDADLARHLADEAMGVVGLNQAQVPPAIAKQKLAEDMKQALADGRIDPSRAEAVAREAAQHIEPEWMTEAINAGVPVQRGAVDRIPGPEHAEGLDPALAAARTQNLGGPYQVVDDVLAAVDDGVEVITDVDGVMGGKHRIILPDGRRFFYKPGQDMSNVGGPSAEVMSVLGDVARPGLASPVRNFARDDFADWRLQDPLTSNPGGFWGADMADNPDATVQPWIEGAESLFDFYKRGGKVTPAMVQQMLETTPLNALSGSWDLQGGNYMVRYVGPGQGPGGGDYALIPIDLDLALAPHAMRKTPIEEVATGQMTGEQGWNLLGNIDERQQIGMVVDDTRIMGGGRPDTFQLNRINPDDIDPTPVYQAADNLTALGPDGIYDLTMTVFSRSKNPDAMHYGPKVAQMLKERIPYLTDYIGNLMKGRPDHIGVAFRERGATDIQTLAAVAGGMPVVAGIGLGFMYHYLTGDEQAGSIPHEQRAAVFDYLREGTTPDQLFEAYTNGQVQMNSKPFQDAIAMVEEMDDASFVALMGPVAQAEGMDIGELLDRKANLREDFAGLIEEMKQGKAQVTGIFGAQPMYEDVVDPQTGVTIRTEHAYDFPQLDPDNIAPKDLSQTDPNEVWANEQFDPHLQQLPDGHVEAMRQLNGQGIPKKHAMLLLRKKFPTMSPATMEFFYDEVRKGQM